eukprot:GHVS01007183.1.p1 GENE.GHVS01007183.1~~GHVS01007183.1.p1  ORF type:complete len:914 (+),score=189.40 GHVS01007183.1:67-2742(+)
MSSLLEHVDLEQRQSPPQQTYGSPPHSPHPCNPSIIPPAVAWSPTSISQQHNQTSPTSPPPSDSPLSPPLVPHTACAIFPPVSEPPPPPSHTPLFPLPSSLLSNVASALPSLDASSSLPVLSPRIPSPTLPPPLKCTSASPVPLTSNTVAACTRGLPADQRSQAVPTCDDIPSQTLPSETLPSETLPSETLPSETLPSETLLTQQTYGVSGDGCTDLFINIPNRSVSAELTSTLPPAETIVGAIADCVIPLNAVDVKSVGTDKCVTSRDCHISIRSDFKDSEAVNGAESGAFELTMMSHDIMPTPTTSSTSTTDLEDASIGDTRAIADIQETVEEKEVKDEKCNETEIIIGGEGNIGISGNSDPVGKICNECSSGTKSSNSQDVTKADDSSFQLPLASQQPSPCRLAPPTQPLRLTHKRNILRQLGSTLDMNACPEWPPIKRNPVVHLHTWQVKSYSYTENGTTATTSTKTKKQNITTKSKIQKCSPNSGPPPVAPSSVSPGDAVNSGGVDERCIGGTEGDNGGEEDKEMVKSGEAVGGERRVNGTFQKGYSRKEIGSTQKAFKKEGGVQNCPPSGASSRILYKGPAWLSHIATVFDGVETGRSTLGRTAGLGLFATRMFAKNSVVTEFVGWSIDRQDALAMRHKRKASHIVKSFGFREYICGISEVQPFIGGGSFANDGSEDLGGPGNNTKWYDFFDSGQGKHRKFLKATKDIGEGEEVFVCYHKNYWKDVGEEDGRGYLPAKCTRNIKAVEGRSKAPVDEADIVGRGGKKSTKDVARNTKKSKASPVTIGDTSKKKRAKVEIKEEKKGKKRRREGQGDSSDSGSSSHSGSAVVVLIENDSTLQWDWTGIEAVRFSWSDVEVGENEEVEEKVKEEEEKVKDEEAAASRRI